MKYFSFIYLFLNFLLINSQNIRNLILAVDPEKLKTLTDAATKTVFQLYGITVDFQGRSFTKIEDEEKKVEVGIYGDQEIPDVEEQFRFEIKNYIPIIPEMDMYSSKIFLFGETFDIKEQYKQMATSISNVIAEGFVIFYKKSGTDILSSTRYKCFVNDTSGNSVGSFEISVADKNDLQLIEQAFDKWKEENKEHPLLKKYQPIVSGICILKGLIKDIYNHHKKKSISSFLKIPFFALLLIFGLF